MKGLKLITKETDNKTLYKIGIKEESWKLLESGAPIEITYSAGHAKVVVYLRRIKGNA